MDIAFPMPIALDDFGMGYSSPGYLHRIPIDTLKIDRTFIKNITSDWNSAAIPLAADAAARWVRAGNAN